MDMIKSIRCILCLLKCSKYLYFAKKMLCIVTVLLSAVITVKLLSSGRKKCGILKELM